MMCDYLNVTSPKIRTLHFSRVLTRSMEILVLPPNFLIFFCLHIKVDNFFELPKQVNTTAELEHSFQYPGLIAQLGMQSVSE